MTNSIIPRVRAGESGRGVFVRRVLSRRRRRELRCDGAAVPLAPQVFDLLLYLLRNRDRVVTKDDLLEAVWGGRIVSEAALTTRTNAARRAIGGSGEAQRLIRTLPRRGFRFIGAVREGETPALQSALVPRSKESPGLAGCDLRPPVAISAERCQLTVISCGLSQAAASAARLDPEDLRDLLAAYHHALAEIAGRFDGYVGNRSGDGMSIYFGYPQAHEDDAERAIRCALMVCDTMLPLEPDEGLPTRIGIATGIVVVGEPIDTKNARELAWWVRRRAALPVFKNSPCPVPC